MRAVEFIGDISVDADAVGDLRVVEFVGDISVDADTVCDLLAVDDISSIDGVSLLVVDPE